jgi:hypothetical protein
MKMIKPGKTIGGVWEGRFACTGGGNGNRGCDAVFEVSGDDMFRTYASYMGRDEDHFVTFMCPACGEFTDVWDTKGPYRHPEFPDNRTYRDFPKCNKEQRDEAKRLLREGTYTPPHKVTIQYCTSARDNG